jgi:hypothetical protein
MPPDLPNGTTLPQKIVLFVVIFQICFKLLEVVVGLALDQNQ